MYLVPIPFPYPFLYTFSLSCHLLRKCNYFLVSYKCDIEDNIEDYMCFIDSRYCTQWNCCL